MDEHRFGGREREGRRWRAGEWEERGRGPEGRRATSRQEGGGGSRFPGSDDWRNWTDEEIREDLARRTDEEEIDRRLMWSPRGEPGEVYSQGSEGSSFRRGRHRGSMERHRFWPEAYGYEAEPGERSSRARRFFEEGEHGWERPRAGARGPRRELWAPVRRPEFGSSQRGEGGFTAHAFEPEGGPGELRRGRGHGGHRRGRFYEGSERGDPGEFWRQEGYGGFRGGRGRSYGGYEREGGPSEYGQGEGYGEDPSWSRGYERGGGTSEYRQGEGYGSYGEGRSRPRGYEREGGPSEFRRDEGYGGYGGGRYGGSYGGVGPGPAGTYRPAGERGGVSGSGSLSGTFGYAAGWEPERMGIRPTSTSFEDVFERGKRREGTAWDREGPSVRELMSRDPKVVGPDSSVRDAARLMREEDAGIVPVVLDGKVLGVITDRDLAIRVLAEGREATSVKCREVMSSDVQSCSPGDRLVDVVRIMGEENVRRLPVVGRDGRIQGILSMTDIAREAELDYTLQEALEQIASRRSFWSHW